MEEFHGPEGFGRVTITRIDASETTQQNPKTYDSWYRDIGMRLLNTYNTTRARDDYDAAIQEFQDVLKTTPKDHPNRAGRLEGLGIAYLDTYLRFGMIEDLETSIQKFQIALDTTPIKHPNRASILQYIGMGYRNKYLRTGAIEDLNFAITQFEDLLDTTPESTMEWSNRLHNLGTGYYDRYQRTGAMDDIEAAIQHFQDAINLTLDPKNPNLPKRFQCLGIAYHDRYERTGAIKDLDNAIEQCQNALDMTPVGHPDRTSRLHCLAVTSHDRYRRIGGIENLENVINQYQVALDTIPEDHPDRANRLLGLGSGYYDRSEITGAIEDLGIAIGKFREAVDITPDSHPAKAHRLQSLATGYRHRYNRMGEIADLDTAIQIYQDALDITPEGHPDRSTRIHSLASGYQSRYERLRAMEDLNISIQRFQDALDITPENHIERVRRLQCLGMVYGNKFDRTGAIEDLEVAIKRHQEALDAAPEGHPDLAGLLQGLGMEYHNRYNKTGAIEDLENAIRQSQYALEMVPEGHIERANILQGIGVGYYQKYLKTEAMEDLEPFIQQSQKVIDITPGDHPDRSIRLQNLGRGYYHQYQITRQRGDLETSIAMMESAFNHSQSPPIDRFKSAKELLNLHAEAEHWSLAYETASAAVSLVPLITPRSLETSDKQHLLTDMVGLASTAAAVALMAGKLPHEAIHLLELGRGVIIGSLNEMRTEITHLKTRHPSLAEKFILLRDQLDTPASLRKHDSSPRYNSAQELEQTIHTIRELPGFNTFMMPPSEDELKGAAATGPIVIINVNNYRCDALIIETNKFTTVNLPRLHVKDIKTYTATLTTTDTQLLEWLWDTITEPILNELGFTTIPTSRWPHVWWIPTGPLANFPIHAAGYHLSSSDTVLDRVISSYSSSVKAIIHSRQRRPDIRVNEGVQKAVLIGMPELKYASEEVERLEKICNSMKMQVLKPQPIQKDILVALRDCDVFHFAGHGETNRLDPSKSSLIVSDGRLQVASLLETGIRGRAPFLAYLSACGTGQIEYEELIDEGLHLVAACQVVGFQHVIGTLWKVDDELCADVATLAYGWLRKEGLNDEAVCEGLHHAARSLRDRWVSDNTVSTPVEAEGAVVEGGHQKIAPRNAKSCEEKETPLNWAPYVHFGI